MIEALATSRVPGEGELDLPRVQVGARPQHLLLTILGDYWYGRDEHLPSAALVDLLAEFDVTAVGARAALSRLARRGLLSSSKSGRRTYYGLTPRASVVLTEGIHRILSFGAAQPAWNGQWTVAAFSIPEEQRDLRHALRTRLRWLGLASLYDGVWVSPHDVVDDVTAVLVELAVPTATVFASQVAPGGPRGGDPVTAWNLDELRGVYDELIAEYQPLLERARGGRVGTAEALVARTALMDSWRNLPNLDPELPGELLAAPWPRDTARALFVELYDMLAPLAETRVRQVIGGYDPGLAARVRSHGSKFAATMK
jgi:phenylacetic acid degradation operon negative regulatory protein